MSPRGTARLCSTCDKLVHDLSAMTEREAHTLLRTQSIRGLCIRYLHDADGEIWFGNGGAERLVPTGRLARRGAVIAAAAAIVLTPVLTEACGGANPNPNPYSVAFDTGDAGDPTGQERRASDPSVASADGGTGVATDAATDAARVTETAAADASSDTGAADAGIVEDAAPE